MKKLISLLLVICVFAGMLAFPAQAASTVAWSKLSISSSNTIKCYVCGTSNVTTYTSSALSSKSGSVYVTDEITVLSIGKNSSDKWYAYIRYPLDGGGTKKAYIPLSAITPSTNAGTRNVASAKISTIFKRPGTEYGSSYISKGDVVYVLGTSGNYTQVLYTLDAGGWKMAWIKSSAAQQYLSAGGSSTPDGTSARLAEVAAAEVGYQGTKSNGSGAGDYTKYGKWMGNNGVQWCAEFVSWCVNQAGVSTSIVPKTASTLTMAQNSNSYYTWSSGSINSLKKGDVIFFSTVSKSLTSNGSKVVHHVGIVYSVNASNNQITIIEGNTSTDKVKQNTYTVKRDTGAITNYSGHYFCGYISV